MSIRCRITCWLILVGLIPITILTYQSVYTAKNYVKNEITILNQSKINTVHIKIDNLIDEPMHGLAQLAQNPILKTMKPAEIKSVLAQILKIYPDISTVMVDNILGKQIVRSDKVALQDVSGRDYFIRAMKGEKKVFSGVLPSMTDQHLIIVIATPIVKAGKVIGVVQASLNLTQIHHFIREQTTNDYTVYIIGTDEKLIAHPNYIITREKDRLNLSKYSSMRETFSKKRIRSLRTVNFENKPVILSSIFDKKTGWIICSETPYTRVIFESRKRILSILFLGVAVLGMVVWVSVKAGVKITKPIRLLQSYARRIAGGDYLTDKFPITTNDEIGKLAVSFQEMVDYLFKIAYYDTLTGLKSWKYFINTVQKILGDETNPSAGAEIFIDLDNFKTINDTFGYSVGYLIIKEIGHRFTEKFPDLMIARAGGDGFLFLLDGVTDRQKILDFIEKLDELIQEPINWNGHELWLTACIGVALYPGDGKSSEELFKNADTALYKAKEKGRNKVEFYTGQLSKANLEQLDMESDLRKAITNQEIVTYYQPQFNAGQGELIGFEALVRWNSPKYGFLNPGEFIGLAEQTGIICDLGELVFRQACTFAKKVNTSRKESICVSVNVSPVQLMHSDFIAGIDRIVQETGVDPQWIGIEITESTMISNFKMNSQKIKFLKDTGFKIYLDDFGTGYSSLNYLRKLPVSAIKIDKTFVDDIAQDDKYLKITRAIVDVSHELDFQVIAEGVETQEQQDLLSKMNCDYMQGFLLGKPVSENEAFRLVSTSSL